MYVNNAQFSSYTDTEKAGFKKGTITRLRENGHDVSAIILAQGSYNAMEKLEPYLEEWAVKCFDTDRVMNELETLPKAKEKKSNCESTRRLNLPDDENSNSDETDDPEKNEIALEKKKLKLMRQPTESLSPSLSSPAYQPKKNKPQLRKPIPFSSIPASPPYQRNIQPQMRLAMATTSKSVSPSDNPKGLEPHSTSQLILAELCVQTTVVKQLSTNQLELAKALKSKRCDQIFPKVDKRFDGYRGPFMLSSISSPNPNIFARNFLRQLHPPSVLKNMILHLYVP